MLLGENSNFPVAVGHDGGGALTFEQIQTVPEESSFEIAGLENWTLSVWVQQSTNGESNLVGRSDGGGTTNKWWPCKVGARRNLELVPRVALQWWTRTWRARSWW